jgi:hypothetical protein
VRKVRGGGDSHGDRFIVLTETTVAGSARNFTFTPTGPEMTMREVSGALMAQGISEADALAPLNAAIVSFEHA